jgi:hypothetical protein
LWEIAALVPGDEPLKSLAASMVPLLFPELDPIDRREKANKLATKFAEGSIKLRDIVRDVLDRQTGTQRLLLIGDQWEELYTLTKDESQRRRFVDELLDATSRSPLSVVLTLRGDFVGESPRVPSAFGPAPRRSGQPRPDDSRGARAGRATTC